MDRKDVMWNRIISFCEGNINTGNNFKGMSGYSSTNMFLTEYK